MSAAGAFALPAALEAHEPPEARGLARDEVRLMAATRTGGRIEHRIFRELPDLLAPGDLLVVNTSATIPAALGARREDGSEALLHVSTPAPHAAGEEWWIVELRAGPAGRTLRARTGEALELDGGARAELVAPYAGGTRLWLASVAAPGGLRAHLARHGRPVRYRHVPAAWPLAAYQTAYALEPGSAEMPSAGRPFTAELVTRLVARGIVVAPVTLHAGVSSPERHEAPAPEPYAVPAATARLVNAVRWWGGRVVAVGTTVVRALETAAGRDGSVQAGSGWTSLVIGPDRPLRAVDGLVTGWHEAEASHLALLEAVAGPELLARSYAEALQRGYLWHEFGDSHLILP
jgi:S-adenosylmethionine:tRNA ribosyltransferase-isomerase